MAAVSSSFLDAVLLRVLQQAQNLDFGSRVLAILHSNFFLGTPYGSASNSKEQKSVTSENIIEEIQREIFGYSFQKFDCVTFVEVICALGLVDLGDHESSLQENFEMHLKSIRYKKSPACYMNSNHFTSADWLPNNDQYFQDVSVQFEFKVASAQIERVNFFVKKLVQGDGTEARARLEEAELVVPRESATLNYNEITYILENISIFEANLPPVSIASICRPNWDLVEAIGSHLNVSHMGFVLNGEDGLRFVHASSWPVKEVVEVPLIDYLMRFRNHETIKGINFHSLR